MGLETVFLCIKIKVPAGVFADQGRYMLTKDKEVTVGFDYNHYHFSEVVGYREHFGTDYSSISSPGFMLKMRI
jgi:hypothetical protein